MLERVLSLAVITGFVGALQRRRGAACMPSACRVRCLVRLGNYWWRER